MTFVEIIFGWPAIITSIVVTTTGIAVRSWVIAFIGAIIAIPFMFYLFGTPRFMLVPVPVAFAHFSVAYALYRGRRLSALVLFAPFVALVAYVALMVARQAD
jgi:hypothetical protein